MQDNIRQLKTRKQDNKRQARHDIKSQAKKRQIQRQRQKTKDKRQKTKDKNMTITRQDNNKTR